MGRYGNCDAVAGGDVGVGKNGKTVVVMTAFGVLQALRDKIGKFPRMFRTFPIATMPRKRYLCISNRKMVDLIPGIRR